ncbi:DNA polymerase I - 3'-5' exonuclease and polymerase domains [Pelotomaculum thermopropionicum SI]|uniref:DNA polymerase I n=1 Tax=Pelotomaculum thermopropionicum (strain DSM 13744 / JCM 10971 / SI) TaxID=370438 RepID=A5D0T5_PELTS|nr:DNA polymerase I - 3'-5' exonuclease and polymerase domains [Pelotomaculum thermopropionicum SI]
MTSETMVIIDGNSLAHRAYHAIPPLSTSQGILTNAVYGFTNMLLKILAEEHPDRIAVAFDKGKITFRHDDFEKYKAHRPATPDDLRPQFPVLKEVLKAMRIQVFEAEGYEADDLIGTLSARAEQAGLRTIIVTGDRDALQLVSPLTSVRLVKKGISELDEYDEGMVWQRYGITPRQYADFKGLTGDASDNIPGIPGIGEKTASRLLKEYGSLEEIIAHADELAGRTGELVKTYKHQAELSKKLATIHRDVPVEIDLALCRWQGPDHKELLEIFKKLEFKSLIKSIYFDRDEKTGVKKKEESARQALTRPNLEVYQAACQPIDSPARIKSFIKAARKAGKVSLVLAGDGRGGIAAASFALEGESTAYSLDGPPDKILEILKTICEDGNIKKYCHNGKETIRLLHRNGITLRQLAFDTMIAAYLLNPASSNQDLEDISLEHLNAVLPGEDRKLPAQAHCIMELAQLLDNKLKLYGQDRLFYEIEIPLAGILAEMEIEGVAVDKKQLEAMSEELGRQIEKLADEIYRLTGREFNINSPKQLGKVLFEDLKLPVIKKTKTGYSTDADVLEELAAAHEAVAKILEYRQMAKLKSTYADGLAALINPETGKLHTTFHQTVTNTGRLSSSDPNLQNIPIRLEAGRLIRKVFIPGRPENLLLTADYSQIELRVLAHISGDPALIKAFKNGEDIHTRTAAEIFAVRPEEVTREMRTRAKAVNFGIVYGLSDFGLARDIKVSRQEARRYIENYFARYAGVKDYIERIIREARQKGYVTTLLNRRRYLPDLFSPNRTIRSFGERTAMNTPIQGSAADIIKLAMVNIHRELAEHGLKAKMILQVHDELIFDAPAVEIDQLKDLVKRCMENALVLEVPLLVEIKAGRNWYDVKKI